jgi:hypothetical protein
MSGIAVLGGAFERTSRRIAIERRAGHGACRLRRMHEHDDDLEMTPAAPGTHDDADRIAAVLASGLEQIAAAIARGLADVASAVAAADARRRRPSR